MRAAYDELLRSSRPCPSPLLPQELPGLCYSVHVSLLLACWVRRWDVYCYVDRLTYVLWLAWMCVFPSGYARKGINPSVLTDGHLSTSAQVTKAPAPNKHPRVRVVLVRSTSHLAAPVSRGVRRQGVVQRCLEQRGACGASSAHARLLELLFAHGLAMWAGCILSVAALTL